MVERGGIELKGVINVGGGGDAYARISQVSEMPPEPMIVTARKGVPVVHPDRVRPSDRVDQPANPNVPAKNRACCSSENHEFPCWPQDSASVDGG